MMEIKTVTGDISRVQADAIVVSIFESMEHLSGAADIVDKILDGAITRLVKQGEIKGKIYETSIVHTLDKIPARIIAVVGLGKQMDLNLDKIRRVMAQSCRTLRRMNCQQIATTIHGVGTGEIGAEASAQAVAEGCVLGLYTFRKYVTKEPDYKDVVEIMLVDIDITNKANIERGCYRGKILGDATNLARDLINEPANYMTPSDMANVAEKLAKEYGLGSTILDREQMKEMGMGALLGVAQGSDQPPKMIILNYKGDSQASQTLGFIGKGLTFDSGGISLKSSEWMQDMKGDMSGGAIVMAAMSAIAQLKPRVNVTAIVPATENLPSGKALKPGDVLKAFNGTTVEVVNTDAEGRLILADALSYAVKQGIAPLVDLATLTGACHIALGDVCSGIFTNNQAWVDKIIEAGAGAGERLWQLPMYEEYKEQNKSDVADIKNSGGRYGGAITAAQFLAEFVNDKPWAHIDIAGTFFADKEQGYQVKGGTGVCVRTLINLALASAAPGKSDKSD
jgi:leucyl aminopeptidase